MLIAALLTGCRSPPPPDVMVVVLDTVRSDRLSAYGHTRPTSRQLEAIAAAGVRFADVTAPAPWTWPSHASLFTGLQPWEHGAHWADDPARMIRFDDGGKGWRLSPLRADVPTLAERFADAGYRTVAYSANCLLHPDLGLTRGFSEALCAQSDAAIVSRAEQAMQAEGPLFLFVNLLSAHGPYLVVPDAPWSAQHTAAFSPGTSLPWAAPYLAQTEPGLNLQRFPDGADINGEMAYAAGALAIPEEDLPRIADLYDGDLLRLDAALLALLTAWNARGGDILAVTSDHGELLGEHGRIGHGGDLYPELLSVPLVLAAPGRLPAGAVVETPVELRRLGATLLDLAGLPGLPGSDSLRAEVEGRSAQGVLQAAVWGLPYWAERVSPRFGLARRWVRQGQHVATVQQGGEVALFDLATDPMMTTDLAARQPERAASLAKAAVFDEAIPAGAVPTVSVDALQNLKALGYVE